MKASTFLLQTGASSARRVLSRRNHRYLDGFDALSVRRELSPHRQELLAAHIRGGKPLCVARFGLTELEVFRHENAVRNVGRRSEVLDFIATGDPVFSAKRTHTLMEVAGLKPFSRKIRGQFHDLMADTLPHIDVLASWAPGETWFRDELTHADLIDIEDLAPYHFPSPWSAALESLRVLVIHPYAETISRQYSVKRTLLFDNPNVLPPFTLLTYRPPQAYFGEIIDSTHWFEEFERMTSEVGELDFDVALIGAGPFGMPLAGRIKALGKQAIHLGGTTQVLFGIIGQRWLASPSVANLMNEHWVKPSEAETPPHPSRVERSAYW